MRIVWQYSIGAKRNEHYCCAYAGINIALCRKFRFRAGILKNTKMSNIMYQGSTGEDFSPQFFLSSPF